MREKNEQVRNARSLYSEYKILESRLKHSNLPKIEIDYTTNMINSIKSRIDFSLLESHKKTDIQENEYSDYNDFSRDKRWRNKR
jgi:hypothetical protein